MKGYHKLGRRQYRSINVTSRKDSVSMWGRDAKLRGLYACQPRNDTFNVIMTSNDTDPLNIIMQQQTGYGGIHKRR